MKKKMKKAFTLVELLVVIAILAVLASVAIVGYNAFTVKAEKSVDEQAVTQMNIVLSADEIQDGKATTIEEVRKVLIENGYNGQFETYYSGYKIVWLSDVNRLALIEDGVVVYPETYEGRSATDSNVYFFDETLRLPNAYIDIPTGDDLPELDGAMTFKTYDTPEGIAEEAYKDFYVEFVLYSDSDINISEGYLWGRFHNLFFKDEITEQIPLDGLTVVANEEYKIINMVYPQILGIYAITYEQLLSLRAADADSIIFDCGLFIAKDCIEKDVNITLELRLYEGYDDVENAYSNEYHTIGDPYYFTLKTN